MTLQDLDLRLMEIEDVAKGEAGKLITKLRGDLEAVTLVELTDYSKPPQFCNCGSFADCLLPNNCRSTRNGIQ